jgi:hypothetical protein
MHRALERACHQVLLWLSMHPFGLPVEPDVYISKARLSGSVAWTLPTGLESSRVAS